MKENKNNEVVKYILENYDIKDTNDIAGALKDMFKDTIQTMMNAELETSIGYEKNDNKIEKNNYRNGYSSKSVKSKFGEFDLTVPRDRNAQFEPQIVPKSKRDISGVEEKVINLYGKGLSTKEISDSIEDIYGVQLSATMISNITDAVLEEIEEWQKRPLKEVYPNTMQQRCIVHLIRNSVKFVSYKLLKSFCNDLRSIYKANNEKAARENLEKVKDKWKDVYPTSMRVWEDNWEAVCTLFNYSKELRKIMYTTNAIE